MSKTLEQKIKDLERELALKQAYLDVKFTFSKGNKFPEDVKEEVMINLLNSSKAFADKEAETTSNFSEVEIKVLKQVAQSVINKSSIKEEVKSNISEVKLPVKEVKKSEQLEESKLATLVSLDNVPNSIRLRMGSGETVSVKSIKEDTAFVLNDKGMGFRVPLEDLEFK